MERPLAIQYNTIYAARRLGLAERALVTNAYVHCLLFVLVSLGPEQLALKEAVANSDAEAVRLLLLFGADPNGTGRDGVTPLLLENQGIPLPFRIQTNSLKVLKLEFKVLDEIIQRYIPEKNSHLNNKQSSLINKCFTQHYYVI
jgi:hypothetical protein